MVLCGDSLWPYGCISIQGLLSIGKHPTHPLQKSIVRIQLTFDHANQWPQIVKTLDFSKTVTYLIQAPPYVFVYFVTLIVSWSSGRNLEHCYLVATMVGAVVMISTLNVGARYFSLFLLCTGPFIGLNARYFKALNQSIKCSVGH